MSEPAPALRPSIFPAGDRAVCVELGDDISVEINTRVRALELLIQDKGVAGVVETVPTFRSLLVYYDPLATDTALCAETLEELASQAGNTALPPSRQVELPCCYDPELGLDLEAAARRLELSPDELVRLHAGAHVSRLLHRLHAGPAVHDGDAGAHPASAAGDAAHEGPPGQRGDRRHPVLHLLRRESRRLLDPRTHAAAALRSRRAGARSSCAPGTACAFAPIDRAEFDTIAAAVAARTYQPQIA